MRRSKNSRRKQRDILSHFVKYLDSVADCGLAVSSETTIIKSAEPITIGTTGMKPRTAVPPGVRASSSRPPIEAMTVAGPGAGAGTMA